MLEKVISGCQTGADQAGLIAAKKCGLDTGGFVLKNNKTEVGIMPHLIQEYNLTELNSSSYPFRTLANVQHADATWIFYRNTLERGSLLTKKYCEQVGKKHMTLDVNYKDSLSNKDYLVYWLSEAQPKVLNIAGNRESVAPGIQLYVQNLLVEVFNEYQSKVESTK